MKATEYHSIKAVSASLLKAMAKSPAHAQAYELGAFEETAAQAAGSLKHMLTLEPERADSEVAVYAGRRAGKAWEAFEAANAGKTIVTETEYDEALNCSLAIRRHPEAVKLLKHGAAEEPVIWEVAGHRAKSRLDYLTEEAITDLKFTRDASPAGYPYEAMRYGLPLQAAFYTDAVLAKTGKELPFFVVACEPGPVYAVTVFRVPQEVIELGRAQYLKALRQYEWCKEKNEWPAYSAGVVELKLPDRAFTGETE